MNITKLIDARVEHVILSDLSEHGLCITIITNDESYLEFIEENYSEYDIEIDDGWIYDDVEYKFGIKLFYSEDL